jgi:hypothetical protein
MAFTNFITILVPFLFKNFQMYFGLSLYIFVFVIVNNRAGIKLNSVTFFGITGLIYYFYLWFPLSFHIPELLNPIKSSIYFIFGLIMAEMAENIISRKKRRLRS